MKQRITIEQLKELNSEQQTELRAWWKPVYGEFFSNGYWENIIQSEEDGTIRCVSTDQDGCYDYERKEDCLPLLSIGQMIDLLQSLGLTKTLTWIDWHKDNVCDQLWEAVKCE